MASKVTKKLVIESKLVRCKNCRQNISKDKMFLHEGFCSRNNTFCEHCEKVFLNKDYLEHVKLIPKNLFNQKHTSSPISQESKDTQQDTLKQSSFTEENEYISNTMMPVIPHPSLEIVQMPITELYKINEPIFVNESGQIISDKNKNGFSLPFLGMNFRSSKISEKIIDDIIDQGEIFKEHNTISQNCYDLQGLNNLLNRNNYNNKISNSMTIDYTRNLREKNISLGFSNNEVRKIDSLYQNNLLERINSPLSKTIEINRDDSFKQKTNEKIPLNSKQNNSKFNSLSFQLNNNNSQKYLNRKYNFFTFQRMSPRSPVNSRKLTDNMKINQRESIPLDNKICRNTPKRKDNNYLDDSIEYIYYPTNTKEPKDSNSKRNKNKNKFKFYKLSEDKKKSLQFQSEKRKIKEGLDAITCEYCNNKFAIRKYDTHVQNCKANKKLANKIFDIPKPQKKQKKKNLESYIFEDIDEEKGISARKRETLTRNFNASSLNVIALNCDKDNRTLISNPERQIYNSQFKKNTQKISLKKKLFASPIKGEQEKKMYPEDSKRVSLDIVKEGKLRKRLNNLSIDTNPIDEFNHEIKNNRSLVPKKSSENFKTRENDSMLNFNKNKIIFKFPKNKRLYNNSII